MIQAPAIIQMSNALEVAGAFSAQIKSSAPTGAVIDCAALSQFDSSALAALLHAKRAQVARSGSEALKIINVPENLRRLAQLYGVEHLLFS